MADNIPLTLACGDYEILRAIKEGVVALPGIDLTVLTEMDASTRHWRFFRGGEFDVAETSSSNYLIARDHGLPFTAIPVFPHRRFRHGFIYINTGKGIRKPTDLIGRRIGVQQYQASANLWMRGILEHEYGVPHRSVEWFAEIAESVEIDLPPDLSLTRLPDDKSVEVMLAEGELDAVLHPNIIGPIIDGDPRVGRLFPDYKAEEKAFYRRTGIFPIMHLVGIRQEIVDRYPWLPVTLYRAFDEARRIAMKRMADPRIVPLAWYMDLWEEQQQTLGADPWEYGLGAKNRNQLEKMIGYSWEQGMIRRDLSVDDLFLNVG